MTTEQIQNAINHFALPDGERSFEPYGNGHINDTFLLVVRGADTQRFILQRLNKFVFKRPDQVMANIESVTQYLAGAIREAGGDSLRETLTLVPTRSGKRYFVDEQGDHFRIYLFIEHTVSFDLPDSPALFERAAKSFGRFQCQLEQFPAQELFETIKDFHNTPERFNQLTRAIEQDAAGRRAEVGPEIEFSMRYRDEVHALVDAGLPLRVTHNDTKLNNILMDATTGEGVCVIDLDTVMPGLAAHDFGDSIRFGGNTAPEDEADLSKVKLSLPMFEAYARGYLGAAGRSLTGQEIDGLAMGAKLMTLECGLRFLADYLNGDVYFKVHKEKHNLIRARNQFELVRDMERKWDEMQQVIARQATSLRE